MEICSECGSENVKRVKYLGSLVLVCRDCGHDERDDLDAAPEFDKSQKAKGSFSKFRTGGGHRSRR